MTASQRKTFELSEARSVLNALIEKRNKLPSTEEPTPEDITAMDSATRKVSALEVEHRAALASEQVDEERAAEQEPDGEDLERRKLYESTSLVDFVDAAFDRKPLAGAALEFREAELGDGSRDGDFPLALLLDPAEPLFETHEERWSRLRDVERRAVTPLASSAYGASTQRPIMSRVFTRSVAARLRVTMPAVPVGTIAFPYIVTGTTASMAADTTEVAATAGSLAGSTLEPIRLQASYEFDSRSTLLLRDYESALRLDLSSLLSDQMDDQIINGSGAAPNVNGFISELPAVSNPSGLTTWSEAWAAFTGLVDGLNAYEVGDLVAVTSAKNHEYLQGLYPPVANVTHPRLSAWEKIAMSIGSLTASSRVANAAGTSGGAQKSSYAIAAKTSYPSGSAVAPIWRSGRLIVDPYSLALKGQERITLQMFWNFKIIREAGWALTILRHTT